MEVIIVILMFLIYFLPGIMAHGKKCSQQVLAVNLFLGWTFLGWVVAFVWALKDEGES